MTTGSQPAESEQLCVDRTHARPPIGGHNFPKHGGLKAATAEELIDKITTYRAVNALPKGRPEIELALHYLLVAPWLVKTEPTRPVPILGDEVALWTMRVWRLHAARIEAKEPRVAKRLATCVACPFMFRPLDLVRDSYQKMADGRAVMLAGTTTYRNQGVCTHHRWHNAVAARLEAPEKVALLPSPERCWVAGTSNESASR